VSLPTVAQAARNNALWCDAVCRAHGASGEFHPGHWLNRHATPRFYPDVVTLDPRADAAPILALRQAKGAISVKDSFHRLDLAAAGFAPLFDAEWIAALPAASDSEAPHRIADPAALAAWEQAWAGQESGPRIFLPALLADPDIAFIAVEHQGRLAGGILNRGAGVVGLSNSFGATQPALHLSLISAAARLFPGLPVVGYASGERLAMAHGAGSASIGRLRVWQAQD